MQSFSLLAISLLLFIVLRWFLKAATVKQRSKNASIFPEQD